MRGEETHRQIRGEGSAGYETADEMLVSRKTQSDIMGTSPTSEGGVLTVYNIKNTY